MVKFLSFLFHLYAENHYTLINNMLHDQNRKHTHKLLTLCVVD